MTETSRFWDGIVTGDATTAPYDAPTEFAAVMRALTGAGAVPTNLSGVFMGDLNELEVTGVATPVSVDTGRAMVYGNWYQNDAAVTVAISTPAASTRIDRIVLRKDWAAQTVRITRIAGVEGGAAPAMTQTPGTTWDEPLAQVSITTGGVITVTDERQFLQGRPGEHFVAGSQTEVTLTGSVVLTDFFTFSGLSIPVGTHLRITGAFRKDAGAAAAFSIALKLNGTTVVQPNVVGAGAAIASGLFEIKFVYGRTNYLRSGLLMATSAAAAPAVLITGFNADMPTATLTDIVIAAQPASASLLVGIRDVAVYRGTLR